MPQPVPIMEPATGERIVRFVGDRIRFTLHDGSGRNGWGRIISRGRRCDQRQAAC